MKKIVIADDEPNILLSLDFLMRKNGYEVFVARDGGEAIDILEQHAADVVILDIMMPNIDGYQVCEYIRKKNTLIHTKVIFLTAKTQAQDIEKGLQLADRYITKPFSTKNLVKEVESLLNEHE